MKDGKIVTIASMSRQRLEDLGNSLDDLYSVDGLEGFEDLLVQLDHVAPVIVIPAGPAKS